MTVLAFLLALAPAFAQEAAPQTAPSSAPQEDANLPLCVLVLQRRADAPARRDDPNILLLSTLGDMLRNSGKMRVAIYRPTHPTVKRALLDQELAPSELSEPIQPDVLQRLGRILSARYVLSFLATTDKEGLKTETQMQQRMGLREWRVLFSEQIRIPSSRGKRRLKREEMVNLTVDTIATRLNIPSHLASDFRLEDLEKETKGKEDKGGEKDAGKPKPETGTPQTPPTADTGSRSVTPRIPDTPPASPDKKPADKAPGKSVANDKSPQKDADKNKPVEPPRSPAPARPEPPQPAPPKDLSTLSPSGVERAELPDSPPAAPPSSEAKVDYEALAIRFRQQGDLANVITSLRHAINDRPRDLGLRRQLIQAYQERKLLDAAMAETSRALRLAPDDAGLHRLYGDALLAKGDTQGALKAYQEATRRDPGDIMAQVALGDALLADSQYAEAMRAYTTAAKTDPKSPLPHRRLARALLGSAAADPAQYAASLSEVQAMRALIPMTDTDTYREEYAILMRQMASRLADLLDEFQATYQAALTGKRTPDDLMRGATDMHRRTEAAADYLDKLPPAAGHDLTHAHFQQAAAFLLQALTLFKDYLAKSDPQAETAMKGARADAFRELNTANKRLEAGRAQAGTNRSAEPGVSDTP
ncbi:MAG TPA: tetratricopeptide repeat protein [Chthonomonadaceae bacterium]|nr:tetratricopeptide repeat protein [Chthonomonadaceae bacterium]